MESLNLVIRFGLSIHSCVMLYKNNDTVCDKPDKFSEKYIGMSLLSLVL